MSRAIRCRPISKGTAEGVALVSDDPITFFGGVDPETGRVVERNHPLQGRSVSGRILVFPTGKGSTVGSYVLYRLARSGRGPAGIVCLEAEPIVAVGAIISEIPMVDKPEDFAFETGQRMYLDADEGRLTVD
jgi:hypothetical protein